MHDIKAVAFDLGGVILSMGETERFAYWADQLGIGSDRLAAAWRVCSPLLEKGEVGIDEFWTRLEAELGQGLNPELKATVWGHPVLTYPYLRPEMLALIQQLKAAGYKVGLLSNIYIAPGDSSFHAELFKSFDAVCLSSLIHAVKPEPRAYRVLLESLGTEAQETIFVDDVVRNVEGASKVGINGILYTGSRNLLKDLVKLGVNLSKPGKSGLKKLE